MSSDLYIWIPRWKDFQTYQTKRNKPWVPPWIMDHTRQLADDRYLALTAAERGLLHDVRLAFATTRFDLIWNPSRLSKRFGYKVTTKQLEALNRAGFLSMCSRTVLERRQAAFWNGSDPDLEVEGEEEEEHRESAKGHSGNPQANGATTAAQPAEFATVTHSPDDDIPF